MQSNPDSGFVWQIQHGVRLVVEAMVWEIVKKALFFHANVYEARQYMRNSKGSIAT